MSSYSIILFDGICNLCNASIQFVIKRDKRNVFKYASLQSKTGRALLLQFQLPPEALHSFLLIEDGHCYSESTAALKVVKHLPGWNLLYGLIIVPTFLRNGVYRFISRNRYRFFGKRTTCMIPSVEMKQKFLD